MNRLLLAAALVLGLCGTLFSFDPAAAQGTTVFNFDHDACRPNCERQAGTNLDARGFWIDQYGHAYGRLYFAHPTYVSTYTLIVTSSRQSVCSYGYVAGYVGLSSPPVCPALGTNITLQGTINDTVSGWVTIQTFGASPRTLTLSSSQVTPGVTPTGVIPPGYPTIAPTQSCGVFGYCNFISTPVPIPLHPGPDLNINFIDQAQEVALAYQIINVYRFGNQAGMIDLILALLLFALIFRFLVAAVHQLGDKD